MRALHGHLVLSVPPTHNLFILAPNRSINERVQAFEFVLFVHGTSLFLFDASGLMIYNHPRSRLHHRQLTLVLDSSTDVPREFSGPSMSRPLITRDMCGSPSPGYVILIHFSYLTLIHSQVASRGASPVSLSFSGSSGNGGDIPPLARTSDVFGDIPLLEHANNSKVPPLKPTDDDSDIPPPVPTSP